MIPILDLAHEPLTLYERAIRKFGERNQVVKAVEELVELAGALAKAHNDKDANVAEEIADVHIMLEQMKLLYPEWQDYLPKKRERLWGLVEK